MRWLCLFLLLSLAAGADEGTLVREGIPPIPEAVAERLRQYSETRSANLCDWDPTSGGVIILITAAGGAFGALLAMTEIQAVVKSFFEGSDSGGLASYTAVE